MKDLININRLNRFGQNIWTRIKNTFMTKEDAINGVLVGQEWTKIGSVLANTSISLPPTDTFTELYIEMYSSNGTITHNINIRLDSILFESSNNEYREILLDSVYDAQTYVKYDFETNSIIPIMYEGNTIDSSSTEIITNIYTKTNNIEVGNIEAEKIVYDNSNSDVSANNVQGAIDELAVDTVLPKFKHFKLESAGWYRVAKIDCDTIQEANGSHSNSCDIEIKRAYSTLSTEYKKIKLVSLYQTSSFVEEVSKNYNSDTNTITKIRHTVDTTTNTGYIEVYYKATSGNNMVVTLSNQSNASKHLWEPILPVATSETVTNVNVLGSYTFLLNTWHTNGIEIIEKIYNGQTVAGDKEYFTYTAPKKCLVSVTFFAGHYEDAPSRAEVLMNGEIVSAIYNGTSHISIPINIVLNAGVVLNFKARYSKATSYNQLRLRGFVQYLE